MPTIPPGSTLSVATPMATPSTARIGTTAVAAITTRFALVMSSSSVNDASDIATISPVATIPA